MEKKIKEYLAWKGEHAPRASVMYRIWLDYFLQVCGDKKIEDYNTTDLVKYKHWLEQRYNPYSVQLGMVVVKNLFKYLRDHNFQCMVPSLFKMKHVDAKPHRAVTEDEFKKIIAEIPSNEFRQLRDLIMIRLLWDTGVRVSELCDLEITQINENKPSAQIKTKKTGKPRVIVWSEETHQYLMKYMPLRLELQNINKSSGALFLGWTKQQGWSSRLNTRSVQRLIKYYVCRAGIKEKITPHSFRHGWAHKRRDQNAPLAFIQKGLGHINIVSTFVYQQYDDPEYIDNAKKYLKMV